MLVKFGKMEKPRNILVEEDTPTFAKFIAEPFERVSGHSVGNAMRRILLSSLETPGIMSIRLENVPHEFMAIEGVAEDMTNIVLNFKGALLRSGLSEEGEFSRETRIVSSTVQVTQNDLDKNKGAVKVKLGDLISGEMYEVVNPEHHLFTVTKPMKKQVDLRIGYGRGYVPSHRHSIPSKMMDEIVIDTAFSPVRHVNYYVENTRVGQDTDFDRLVIEVTTDGRLTPREALSYSAQIAAKNFEVFQSVNDDELTFEQGSQEQQADNEELLDKLILRIDEIELSVRSTNCLESANIETIAELVSIPEKKMLEFRNFGKKSLNEINAKLSELGLHLGMDLQVFGINSDNVKEKIKEVAEDRRAKKEKKKKEKKTSE